MGQWLECFYFASHHDPQPGFQVLLPFVSFCGSFSKQTGLLVLSGTHSVFATLLFLLPLIPHSWTVISPSLLVTIPSILQREEMLTLTRELSMSLALFTYYFTESLEPSSMSDIFAPF